MGQNGYAAGFRLNLPGDERYSTNEEPFMSQIIPKNRLHAYHRQQGQCYYCGAPMWLQKLSEVVSRIFRTFYLAVMAGNAQKRRFWKH